MHIGIVSAWNYALSVLTGCFVLGIIIYVIDRKVGVHIYRFAYDLFHRLPMPQQEERGFLVNQTSKRGGSVAVFISTVYTLYMVYELGLSINVIAELFIWAGMPILLTMGFWVGRWVYRLLLKSDQYFNKADEIGKKIENVQFGEVAGRVRDSGGSLLSGMTSILSSKEKTSPPTPEPVVKPKVEEGPKLSFQDQLKKFKGG